MNIFFTGSIRGGRAQQPQYAFIVDVLKRYGTVLSEHVSDETLSQYGETNISAGEILEREQRALEGSEVVVAEVTTPSLGVGNLIGRGSALGKRVIALYCGDDTLKLSAIIKGDPNVKVFLYKTEEDIQKVLAEVFV